MLASKELSFVEEQMMQVKDATERLSALAIQFDAEGLDPRATTVAMLTVGASALLIVQKQDPREAKAMLEVAKALAVASVKAATASYTAKTGRPPFPMDAPTTPETALNRINKLLKEAQEKSRTPIGFKQEPEKDGEATPNIPAPKGSYKN